LQLTRKGDYRIRVSLETSAHKEGAVAVIGIGKKEKEKPKQRKPQKKRTAINF
jgi:hypothetical protein